MTSIDKSIDFQQKSVSNGVYRYSRLVQNSGGSIVDVQPQSIQQCIVDIPAAKIINFAKSYMSCTLNFPATTADTATVVNRLVVNSSTFSPIERLTLQTRAGILLMDLPDCGQYFKMSLPLDTPHDKYMSLPSPSYIGATGSFGPTGPSNGIGTFDRSSHTTLFSPSHANKTLAPSCKYQAGVAVVPSKVENIEDYLPSANIIADSNLAFSVKYYLDFSLLKGTILAQDLDTYYGDVLQLTITFQRTDKYSYILTTDSAGLSTITAPAQFNNGVTDLQVMLSCEIDPIITSQIMKQVDTNSLTVTIPYIHRFAHNISIPGSNYTATMRLSLVHGKTIVRIYTGVFHAIEALQTCFDNDNYGPPNAPASHPLLLNWNSYMNSSKLQDALQVCSTNEDYLQQRNWLQGSVINNARVFKRLGNVLIESFKSGPLHEHRDYQIGGIPLDVEQVYSLDIANGASAGGVQIRTFVVCQKTLNISRTAILVV